MVPQVLQPCTGACPCKVETHVIVDGDQVKVLNASCLRLSSLLGVLVVTFLIVIAMPWPCPFVGSLSSSVRCIRGWGCRFTVQGCFRVLPPGRIVQIQRRQMDCAIFFGAVGGV